MFTTKGYIPPIVGAEDVGSFFKDSSGDDKKKGVGVSPALVIVDMTRAFVEDRFLTGCERSGMPCVAANKLLLAVARQAGIPIFFTLSSGRATAAERGLWGGKSTRTNDHSNLSGWNEIMPDIAPLEGETLVQKGKPSAFFGTPLASHLTYHRVDTLIITGMTTSGCVRATVVDAFSHNYLVAIPVECVADRSRISHEISLFDMDMKYADVLPLQDILEYLRGFVFDQKTE